MNLIVDCEFCDAHMLKVNVQEKCLLWHAGGCYRCNCRIDEAAYPDFRFVADAEQNAQLIVVQRTWYRQDHVVIDQDGEFLQVQIDEVRMICG